MAEVNPPLYLDAGSYPSGRDRELVDTIWAKEGRVRPTDFALSAPGGMNVAIGFGSAIVQGNHVAAEGKYLVKNDASVTKAVTAIGAIARKTIVIAEVLNDEYSDGSSLWRLRLVDGTPNASPVEPATPNQSWKIGTLTIPGSSGSINSGMIAQNVEPVAYGYSSGAIIAQTTVDMLAISPVWAGMQCQNRETDSLWSYSGTAWVPQRILIPHTDVVKVVPTANETLTSTSQANLPGSARTRKVGFVKYRADTKLNIRMGIELVPTNGLSTATTFHFSATIGALVTEVCRMWIPANPPSSDYESLMGEQEIPGLAAGTYTVEVQYYSDAVASVATMGAPTTQFLSITETY